MKVTGILSEITEVESGSTSGGKTWKKQNIIVKNEEYHNQPMSFPIFGDKIEHIALAMDSKVTVDFEIVSAFSRGKWYNNIKVFSVYVHLNEDMGVNHFLAMRPEVIL